MSQITRCPECQTRFKVVDDQLRISDGWVRCGKCKTVFDALAHLVAHAVANPVVRAEQGAPGVSPSAHVAPPPAPAPPSAVLVTGNSLAIDPQANVPELSVLVFPRRAGFVDSGYVDSSWMSAYESDAAQAAAPPTPQPADRQALESEWSDAVDHRPESLRNSTVGFSAQDDLAELQAREARLLETVAAQKAQFETTVRERDPNESGPAIPAAKEVLQPAPAPEALVRPEESLPKVPAARDQDDLGAIEHMVSLPPALVAERATADEPGFVRDAKRKAFWSQPSVIVLSLLGALLLVAALVFQMAVAQRDQLAVQHPAWRPALDQVCKLAGCQVALPRDLQHVSIDSTTFNPMGPRQFKLTVVLRNAADYAVAVPALELSLNDAAEKLVLRRVLTPAEMQAPAALAAHGEWTAVVPIQVVEQRQGVVGSRVLAFYP